MRYEDRGCTVRAAALGSPAWRAVGRVLVPGLVAMAAWWYWTATASAETAGTVEAPSADAGPVAVAPAEPDPATDLLAEVEEPELLPVEPVVDVLTGTLEVVEPVTDGLVEGVRSLTPVIHGVAGELHKVQDLGEVVHDLVTPPPPASPVVAPPAPQPRPRPKPAPAPAPQPAPLPRVAPASATTDPARDERAWAPRPAAAPPVVVPTPAAGPAPVETPADAHRPSDGRPAGPIGPQSAMPSAGSPDAGLRIDRGPQISGTPGALAALAAATTAARLSAAVEALEDRPGGRPPTTPD